MNNLKEIISYYRKLSELLEQDYAEISAGMQGDLLMQYREALKEEMNATNNHIYRLHLIEKK